MRSFGLEAIPLLEQTPQGLLKAIWRGWARYQGGDWSGESELQNARIAVDGLAEPLLIRSASVSLNGKRVAVSRLQAQAGAIAFTGSYRWEPRFRNTARQIRFEDRRGRRRGIGPPVRARAASRPRLSGANAAAGSECSGSRVAQSAFEPKATVSIGSLTAGDLRLRGITAQVKWNGPVVHLTELSGSSDPAEFAGDLSIDLRTGTPRYHFDGKVADIAYKGGELDLEGILDAEGEGSDLFESARAEGTLRGRSILFAPDTEFRSVAARFEMQGGGAASRWKLSNVEVNQSGESLAGTGASQADGRLVLELVSRGRPLRYTGTLFTYGGAAIAGIPLRAAWSLSSGGSM